MADPRAKPAVYIETYGCQMNVLDSDLVGDQLAALGYEAVDRAQDAGIVLLNTCSVRELSEQKVWSRLGRLGIAKRDAKPEMVIGVLGCMAEREGEQIIRRVPTVDFLCGPSNLDALPQLVHNALHNRGHQVALAGHTSRRTQTRTAASAGLESLDLSRAFAATRSSRQAYVRITRGCDEFCSFCVVPFVRGPEVHRPPEQIVEEVRRLVDAGVIEVTLLGQTVNHYAHEDGGRTTSFADLLWRIHQEVQDLPRLRFVTSYPRDFGDDALDVMAAAPRICPYLHIPVQSGSDRMLRRMNRGHTIAEYEGLVERARARMPDISLAGDMIVGFPGETDADHAASIALLHRVRYKSCFVFKYSPRPGTVAARRYADDVSNALKKSRNQEILAVQREISRELLGRRAGQLLEVLVEDTGKQSMDREPELTPSVRVGWATPKRPPGWVRLRGRTRGDEIVAFDGPPTLIGRLTEVRATRATPLTIMAQWVPDRGSAPASAAEARA